MGKWSEGGDEGITAIGDMTTEGRDDQTDMHRPLAMFVRRADPRLVIDDKLPCQLEQSLLFPVSCSFFPFDSQVLVAIFFRLSFFVHIDSSCSSPSTTLLCVWHALPLSFSPIT